MGLNNTNPGVVRLPAEVSIEITQSCNFRCPHCFNRNSFAEKGHNSKFLATQFIFEVLDSMEKANIFSVRLTGGEPLQHPEFRLIASEAKKRGFKVVLNTNASLVDQQNIQWLQDIVDSVLVSINGYDSKTDQAWTGRSDVFDPKIQGAKLLLNSRISFGCASTALTAQNQGSLDLIFGLVKELGFKYWQVDRVIQRSGAAILPLDLEGLLTKLAFYSAELGTVVRLANAIPFCAADSVKMNQFCAGGAGHDGHTRMVVDPRGYAKPSYYLDENIGDPRDILSCWNHPFMVKMRNLEMAPKICQTCEYVEKCKGGSRYLAHAFFGSYEARDPLMKK